MSTEVTVVPPKPLTLQQRALVAIGDRDEAELKKLADGTKDITTVTNDAGYKQINAARIVLKNERIAIEKDCKKAREDATAFGKAVIAEEGRLIAIISPEEKRLQTLQNSWDAEVERIRQEKIEAELKRVADLHERVAEMRGCQTLSPVDGSALVAQHIADLEGMPVDETFQEFQQQAADAKAGGLARLQSLHTAALIHEGEQIRIKAEREELAQHRAAQALTQNRLSEIQGIQQQVVIAQIGRSGVRRGGTMECIRDTLAETEKWPIEESTFGPMTGMAQAAKDVAVKSIRDLLTAAELKQADEAQLASDRALVARQQEDLRKAQEPPKPSLPAPQSSMPQPPVTRRGVVIKPPSAAEIVDVLAKHYKAHSDTILDWLQQTDFAQVKAA